MTGAETSTLADEAGLLYVGPETPGHRRVKRGRGFSYLDPEGKTVRAGIRERIENLVIPPAWEDVWIARDPRGHIQATGIDKAGRKQYVYHPLWEEVRDEVKFDRLAPFGRGLAALRRRVDADLRKKGLPRTKVIALAVAVLDRTLIRVGNRRYAEDNESYGLTTIGCEHVHVDGLHVHLEFSGKGGSENELVFEDRRLAGLVSGCQELSGQTLFSYETTRGGPSSISSSDVNDYLSRTPGGPFTAKDFRTWGASSLVLGELARHLDVADDDERLRKAIDVAAERLGNSRAICRDSYVHPRVISANTDGTLEAGWSRRRSGKWLNRDESALRHILETEEGQSW